MTDDRNEMEEIKAQLFHPYIRERQAALEKIKEKLKDNHHVRDCTDLLQQVIEHDTVKIVADQAQKILQEWQRREQVVRMPDDSKHMFGVVCPNCGHQNYYDKREVCRKVDTWMGPGVRRLLLECRNPTCKHKFEVDVDCEGYE